MLDLSMMFETLRLTSVSVCVASKPGVGWAPGRVTVGTECVSYLCKQGGILSCYALLCHASTLVAMASNIEAKASNLMATASDLVAMASDGLQPNSDGLHPSSDGLQPSSGGQRWPPT